jgi:hypothetical protein
MKVLYKTVDGRFQAEFEGTQCEIFRDIAKFEEVFGNLSCTDGNETSTKIIFQVRQDKEENTYYEQVCVDESKPTLRFAKRRFGQHKGKEGTLFPKENGKWFKWNGTEEVPLLKEKGASKAAPKKEKASKEATSNNTEGKDEVPF